MSRASEALFSLEGKVALVTGASSGLGAHFAHVLADAGATVVAAARRVEKLEELVDAIKANGGSASAIALDVTRPESISPALSDIESRYSRIDVLVNNAGVAASRHSLKVSEQDWDHIMETNLKGAWRMAQACASRAVESGRALSIINIASILGLRVGFGECAYAVSKAGVVQLTKALALELARKGIRVNAICPGYFATEMNAEYLHSEAGQAFLAKTPSGRMGELAELDAPLLLLAGDGASFINGAVIPVDGGHLVSSL